MTKKIAILGKNGQLGQCLTKASMSIDHSFDYVFADSSEVDITNLSQIEDFFAEHQPDFCINATAYTAVDLAETDAEQAYAVNEVGVGNLATVCAEHHCTLVHISTDYVFDGETNISYDEDSFCNPMGVYGDSKRKGELLALENNPKTIIIRTSWLYSEYNKNFLKTMLSLFSQKQEIGVVADQYGQPTNANDLAEVIFTIIESPHPTYGIFHYANYPETSWYLFAKKIAETVQTKCIVNPITADQYPTPAKRPLRSTMCLDKIEKVYEVTLHHWEHRVEDCIQSMK